MAVEITDSLVKQLVGEQFPQWADLPVESVQPQGWDNRTFRLGNTLSVRLPSADGYVPGLVREETTLALLTSRCSVQLPRVVAAGLPSELFPRPWSVRRWIEGFPLSSTAPADRVSAIGSVGEAVAELHRADPSGGPWCGPASAFRGCHPSVYSQDVQAALRVVGDTDLRKRLESLWCRAVTTAWTKPARWVHGDLAPGNIILTGDGRVALIDVGQTCVGDPATDLGFAWLVCTPAERETFAAPIDLGRQTWLRGAAWALWKTLISSDADLVERGCRPRGLILNDLGEVLG